MDTARFEVVGTLAYSKVVGRLHVGLLVRPQLDHTLALSACHPISHLKGPRQQDVIKDEPLTSATSRIPWNPDVGSKPGPICNPPVNSDKLEIDTVMTRLPATGKVWIGSR